MKKDILIVILVFIISVSVIVGVINLDRAQKEERALKRVQDLNFIKKELEKYKNEKNFYPSTGITLNEQNESTSDVKQIPIGTKGPMLYEDVFLSECSHPRNYIPDVNFVLPRDPLNLCNLLDRKYYYGGNVTRYGYASNGQDYKFIILYLNDEICDDKRFQQYIDPVRGCNNYNASWSVYSEGAKMW